MDVDGDVEGQLLQQFSSLGTTDKEVLVIEFQKLIGGDINPSLCAFFLDMNNWNLPAAIGSYYDYEQPSNVKVPVMSFVKDVTIGEGESVPSNTNFVKTWRIQNTGGEPWPPGCCLRYIQGERMGNCERVMVDALQPGTVTDVSVDMRSPATTGIFQGQWRIQTATGMYFGEVIWVILQVEEHGLLGVTQQLSNIVSSDFSQQPRNLENPFGSATKSNNATGDNLFGSPSMRPNPFISLTTNQSHLEAQHRFGSLHKTSSMCDSGSNIASNGQVPSVQTAQSPVTYDEHVTQSPLGMAISNERLAELQNIEFVDDARRIETLPYLWPPRGSISVSTHEITTPTPNVSPTGLQTNAPYTDTVEDMT